MADPYSLDLRKRIAEAHDRGEGSYEILATRFGVSRGFIRDLMRHRRETGTLEPLPHSGGPPPNIRDEDEALVRTLVAERDDRTLEELCAEFRRRRRRPTSVPAMCRALKRFGLTRKKSPSTPASARRRGSKA